MASPVRNALPGLHVNCMHKKCGVHTAHLLQCWRVCSRRTERDADPATGGNRMWSVIDKASLSARHWFTRGSSGPSLRSLLRFPNWTRTVSSLPIFMDIISSTLHQFGSRLVQRPYWLNFFAIFCSPDILELKASSNNPPRCRKQFSATILMLWHSVVWWIVTNVSEEPVYLENGA